MTVPKYTVSVLDDSSDMGAITGVQDLPWARIADRLKLVERTAESTADYLLWKETKDPHAGTAKCIGGWVGGTFEGDRRRADRFVHRTVLALDVDHPSDRYEDELRSLGCAMAVHPTHTPGRWRAVAPLSEPLDAARYSRLVGLLRRRVEGVDPASANPVQLMFWPSTPADDTRGTWTVDGPPLDWTAYDLGGPEPERTDIADIPEGEVEAIEREMRARRGPMLRAAVEELTGAPEGVRNDTLNRVSYGLARVGCMDDEARGVLEDAAGACGLPAGEVRATLDSADSAGGRDHDAAVARAHDERVDAHRRALKLFGVDPAAADEAAAKAVRVATAPPSPDRDAPIHRVELAFQTMADTPPEPPPEELWAGRLPLGGSALISGRGGVGKSLFDCWLAARVSRGELPGALFGRPSPVMLIQTEDDWASETRLRLEAAGADPALVGHAVPSAVGAVSRGRSGPYIPRLPMDADGLGELADQSGVKLMILDVLTAMMPSGRSLSEQVDVREMLSGLQSVAQRVGVTILGVNHWRKAAEGPRGDMVSGSHEFRNAVRCLWLAARDDTTGRTVMKLDKYNYGCPGAELSYRIGHDPFAGAPRVEDLHDEPRGAFDECALSPLERKALLRLDAVLEGKAVLKDEDSRGSGSGGGGPRSELRGLNIQPQTLARLMVLRGWAPTRDGWVRLAGDEQDGAAEYPPRALDSTTERNDHE